MAVSSLMVDHKRPVMAKLEMVLILHRFHLHTLQVDFRSFFFFNLNDGNIFLACFEKSKFNYYVVTDHDQMCYIQTDFQFSLLIQDHLEVTPADSMSKEEIKLEMEAMGEVEAGPETLVQVDQVDQVDHQHQRATADIRPHLPILLHMVQRLIHMKVMNLVKSSNAKAIYIMPILFSGKPSKPSSGSSNGQYGGSNQGQYTGDSQYQQTNGNQYGGGSGNQISSGSTSGSQSQNTGSGGSGSSGSFSTSHSSQNPNGQYQQSAGSGSSSETSYTSEHQRPGQPGGSST